MRKKLKFIPIVLATVFLSGYVGALPVMAETADNTDSVFVQKEMKAYEGIYLEVKGKPSDNYRKVGVVLDEPIEIGTNDFLSLTFRNLADANNPLAVTLQDEDGNLLYSRRYRRFTSGKRILRLRKYEKGYQRRRIAC